MQRERIYFYLIVSVCVGAGLAQYTLHCEQGRAGLVQLFEWKWRDVERECTLYLGPKGFCAVQVSPPNEHVVVEDSFPKRPWWERYQPVSYTMTSRSGTDREFVFMVTTCQRAGVRVLVDVVLNNMAHESRKGVGTAGTAYDSNLFYYPGPSFDTSAFHGCDACPKCCCVQSNPGNSERPANVEKPK